MKSLPCILFEKCIHILALETASPRNRHCANCIGTLSFAARVLSRGVRTFAGDRQVRPRLGSGAVDDERRLSGDLVSVVARDVHLSLVRVLMAAYRPSAFHQRDRRTAHHCSTLGQLSLASLRGRLIEYQLRLG